MSAHTPGPWFADDHGVGGSHDRHTHWFAVGPWGGDPLGRAAPDVALVQRKEDAPLIAAAPTMLEKLTALCVSLRQYDERGCFECWSKEHEAAEVFLRDLEKAAGR